MILTPSAFLVRKAMTQGVFGSSRLWKAVAIVIVSRRAFRKIMGSEPRTIAVERLRPGQSLVLRGLTSRDVPAS